jgi:hypothetical protein
MRRKLMVSTIRATQAREGIQTTPEQARRAYYVVTEGEKAVFFWLSQFRPREGAEDIRHDRFVSALSIGIKQLSESLKTQESAREASVRFDVRRADFSVLEGSPLIYRQVRILAPMFREHAKLGEAWAVVRGGMNSTASDRFVRFFWEVASSKRRWVRYSKGGSYARFYADLPLVLDWTDDGRELRALVKERYGSESRFIKSPEFYFKRGLTWTEKSSLGLSVRILDEGAIFNVSGPGAFPKRHSEEWYLLGVLNSALIAYSAWALSGRNYGADYVAGLPVAKASPEHAKLIADFARDIHDAKAVWDHGNELSTKFESPWIVNPRFVPPGNIDFSNRLDALGLAENSSNLLIQKHYGQLDDAVFDLYGVPQKVRLEILASLGTRPPELVWPHMEGRDLDQKRMEHVWRLLSYAVGRIVESSEDGIVLFLRIFDEASLADRVRSELANLFHQSDINVTEVQITNELKRRVKGYDHADGIHDWLENVFFSYHVDLYKKRPICWHISSSQGKAPAAFSALVHYQRFGKDGIAKLRSTYLREAIGMFRREAALAGQQGRTEDKLEAQSKVEEAAELDRRLQSIQEGMHRGSEDYRISTPWKEPTERPKGWDPDIDDGVSVNMQPLQRAGVFRISEVV